MRLTDKKILDSFFNLREICFKNNIEDVDGVTLLIKQALAKIEKLKGGATPTLIYTLCFLIHHYREVIHFSDSKYDEKLIDEVRVKLLSESSGEEAITVAVVNYAIAISYIPFVRGDYLEVYRGLLKNDSFNTYFDGIKKALQYFEKSADVDIPVHLRAMEDTFRTESYLVWMEYCSENHLSDLIYFYYLNSDLRFRDIVTLNDSFMKEIIGLGDEWREK